MFYKALSQALSPLILTIALGGIFISILQIRETDTERLIYLLEVTVIEQLLNSESLLLYPTSTFNRLPRKKMVINMALFIGRGNLSKLPTC